MLLARESKKMVKKSPWKIIFLLKKIYKDSAETLKARGEAGGSFKRVKPLLRGGRNH